MGFPMPTELIAFVRERYATMPVAAITAAYNSLGGRQLTEQQVKSICKNHGIKSGRDGRFGAPGFVPWNTGTKGQGLTGANRCSFKTGNVPPNRNPLWTERICSKDGFILMKVPEQDPHTGFPTRYKHKHVWIWEQANGPVPQGMAVSFIDTKKLHCELENLMLVTRNELLLLNLHKYSEQSEELRPSILALAKLEAKAGYRTTGRAPGAGRKKKEH